MCFRVLDIRSSIFFIPYSLFYWILDTGCWILDTWYWMLDTGCSILDTRCSMLDTRCSILDIGYSILDIFYSLFLFLISCFIWCWMLDTGGKPSLHFIYACAVASAQEHGRQASVRTCRDPSFRCAPLRMTLLFEVIQRRPPDKPIAGRGSHIRVVVGFL